MDAVASVLRAFDRETVSLTSMDGTTVYRISLSRCLHAYTALQDGEPVAMWGAAADSFVAAESAHLWLLVSDKIERPIHALARGAIPFVRAMQKCYTRLTTTVLEGHRADQRWVEWLGFQRDPAHDCRVGAWRILAYERR